LNPEFSQEIRTAGKKSARFAKSSTRAGLALPLPLSFADARPVDSAVRRLRVVFDAKLNPSCFFLPRELRDQREREIDPC
jgi:hypothetical protein